MSDVQVSHKTLEFSYDPALDVMTIEGIRFSGDVFRLWSLADKRFYRFEKSGDLVKLDVVYPCPTCRGQLSRAIQ